MNGQSLNIAEEKKAILQSTLPEIFTEGKIDLEKLKLAIGEDLNIQNERYVLNWAGKSEAFKVLQTPTTATLVPNKADSVNFETTENIFIEGENLEVLKVLQKAYYNKIKMIYIDPPYNTGSDSFIYPDKFQESKEEYLKRIGDKDEEGYLLKEGLFRKNSKDSGHYHSNWLSMIYPRLFLARNLLREDGVIFVSIGDEEVHNLRLALDEVFGEENFEGHIHWRRRYNQPNDPTKMIAIVAEHILVFAKNKAILKEKGVGKIGITGDFSNPDNDPRGDWASKPWKVGTGQTGSRYKITTPTGKILEEDWMGEEATYNELLYDKRIYFPNNGNGQPRKKYFKTEREEEGQCANNWWNHEQFGHNQGANEEMAELFGTKNVFDNPKPTLLIKNLMRIANCQDNDIVLDFFCGSGTTAHAAYELNREEKLHIKTITVQLAEKIGENEEAYNQGFRTIAQIARKRLQLVCNKIDKEIKQDNNLFTSFIPDLGYKAFTLKPSNFKLWRGTIDNPEELAKQIDAFVDPTKEGTVEENMVYELLLKSGKDLNSKIEHIKGETGEYFYVNNGERVIVLSTISEGLIKNIIAKSPSKVIVLDKLFEGNDQLKTNTVLQMRDAEIDFRTL